MKKNLNKKIINFINIPKTGGPSTFIKNLLTHKTFNKKFKTIGRPHIVFINGGSKNFFALIYYKIIGCKIVQRLDSYNYIYKFENDLIFKIKSILRNFVLLVNRYFFSDYTIYQSAFTKNFWQTNFKKSKEENIIIYNGVDTNFFKFKPRKISKIKRIICVEGEFANKNIIISILSELKKFEVILLGKYSNLLIKEIKKNKLNNVKFLGYLNKIDLLKVLHESDLYLSLEINPSCSNSILEAMSTGLPILAYDTGSIKEQVSNTAGICMNYVTNSYKVEIPDVSRITNSISLIEKNYHNYSLNSSKRAIEKFNINLFIDNYIDYLDKIL